MRIVLPGGSGQVGTVLARHFHQEGHKVTVLSRTPRQTPWLTVVWDGKPTTGDWMDAIDGSDVCINLAGRSVNCRYGEANRLEIVESRVQTTNLLQRAMETMSAPPRVWLNASTATIYRHSLDRPMDEVTGELGGNEPGAPDTWNFSIRMATEWERAFFANSLSQTRKVAMRSAITFSPDRGGAFDLLLGLVRRGLGGTQGSGQQFVSWIHEYDFCRAVKLLIDRPDLSGVVNIAAPNPIRNCDFMRELRLAWGTWIGLPANEWMIEFGAFFLRTESELALKSRQVVARRLKDAGFEFLYPEWSVAAQELVTRWRRQEAGGVPETVAARA